MFATLMLVEVRLIFANNEQTASKHQHIHILVTTWCKQRKRFFNTAASQALHGMSTSVLACVICSRSSNDRPKKKKKKTHFTWPVWPSGNVKETLFFCWKTNAKWVTDAKKWTQCEIQPRESRFFFLFFFRWHWTRGTTDSVTWISVEPHFKPHTLFIPAPLLLMSLPLFC